MDPARREESFRGRTLLIRAVVLATAVLGLNCVIWRRLFSINWDAWWIAIPLVLAEASTSTSSA